MAYPNPDPNPDPDPNPNPNPNPKVKWTVVPLCVEVGARGAINEQPWNWMCKCLGFSKCSKRRLTQGVQDAAVACSYYNDLCRFLGSLVSERQR